MIPHTKYILETSLQCGLITLSLSLSHHDEMAHLFFASIFLTFIICLGKRKEDRLLKLLSQTKKLNEPRIIGSGRQKAKLVLTTRHTDKPDGSGSGCGGCWRGYAGPSRYRGYFFGHYQAKSHTALYNIVVVQLGVSYCIFPMYLGCAALRFEKFTYKNHSTRNGTMAMAWWWWWSAL